MLFFSPQIWTSDNTDVLARMKIQYGTMLAYPARCIGTHISSVPNHITGDTSRLRTRAFVAMSGTFGLYIYYIAVIFILPSYIINDVLNRFELDIRSLSIGGEERCRKYSDMFKSIYHIVHNGDLYRLWNPFKVQYYKLF
jgi:alpha-galactosidase